MILLNEIGGSMGPIYGTVFMAMADEADGKDEITVSDLYQMLDQAKKGAGRACWSKNRR